MEVGLSIGLTGVRSGWSPLRLSGLKAWSECDRPVYQDAAMSTLAGPGDPVGGVPDRSGAGYHATQGTTAHKPTLVAGAFPSGRSGLSFDGVDDRLLMSGLAALFSGADKPFSVALACRVADTSSRALQGMGNSGTSSPYCMFYVTGSAYTQYRRDDALAWVSLTGPAMSVNQPQVVIATFGETPGVVARIALNGGSESNGPMDVGATTLDRFTIGTVERAGTPLYPFKGVIGAWVVVARAISAPERTALAAYLMRWAGM